MLDTTKGAKSRGAITLTDVSFKFCTDMLKAASLLNEASRFSPLASPAHLSVIISKVCERQEAQAVECPRQLRT